MNKILKYGIAAMTAVMTFTACDWTEPEAVDLRYDNIQEAAPDAYARYLAGLREYRTNGHKKVYAWFENKTSFVSQADHVSAVPDSIDVLVFTHPEAMSQATLNEIDTKRSETGMQTAYMVSYEAIRGVWELKKEDETPDKPVKEWSEFMVDSLRTALSYFRNGGFDRIICAYDGKDMGVYGEAERAEYEADQKAFMKAFEEWRMANIDKGYDFCGIPYNLHDMSLLQDAGTIFLSETLKATNTSEFAYIIRRNSVVGAPVEKFAILAYLPSLAPNHETEGFWGDTYSSWEAAKWARSAHTAALGLYNLSDDYHNPTFIYPVARGAIQRLNPAAR